MGYRLGMEGWAQFQYLGTSDTVGVRELHGDKSEIHILRIVSQEGGPETNFKYKLCSNGGGN